MRNASYCLLVLAAAAGSILCAPAAATPSGSKQPSSDQRQREAERVEAEQALVVFLGVREAARYKVLWDGCGQASCEYTSISKRGVTFDKLEPASELGVSRDTHVSCSGGYAIRWTCYSKSTTATLTVKGEEHKVQLIGPVTDSDLVSVALFARSSCIEQARARYALSHSGSAMGRLTDVLTLPFLELERNGDGLLALFGRSSVNVLILLQSTTENCGFELKSIGSRVY